MSTEELELRDRIAIAALPALIQTYPGGDGLDFATTAYIIADAMLVVRQIEPRQLEPQEDTDRGNDYEH